MVLLAMRLRSIINRNCGFGKGQKCWAGWRNKDESDGIEVPHTTYHIPQQAAPLLLAHSLWHGSLSQSLVV